jgi:D-beta-D-heptose 7-phosphate kinase/D-beta-D-heptose 1-phosphate adenosyltransferase
MNELKNIQQQRRFKVLLIGDDCIDVYRYGTIDRISPEAPVPIFKFSHQEKRPGMAGNVRENLEKLGCEVTFLSNGTSVKTRLIDMRSRQHIVRMDEDVQCQPIDLIPELGFDFDAIVISDYNKGTVTYELIEELVEHFDGPIFVDTKKTDLKRLNGCIVKINELEHSLLKTECVDLIVTLGDKGVRYKNFIFGAPKVEVSDVTGAGDTFLSALAYAYLNTQVIELAIPFAINAATVTVQKLGVYAPTMDEIL